MINFTSVTKVLINSRQVYLHPSFKHPLQRYDFHRLLVKIRKDLIKAGVNEQARESVVWIELAFDPRIPKTFSTSFSTRAVDVIFHGGGKNAWSSEDRTKPLITSAEDLTRFSRSINVPPLVPVLAANNCLVQTFLSVFFAIDKSIVHVSVISVSIQAIFPTTISPISLSL